MPVDPVPTRLAGIGDEAAVELTGQIEAIRALGWSAIELRTVDGSPLAELTPRHLSHARRSLREAGVDVVCLASRIGNWARPITGSFVEDLRELDILAEQCDIFDTRMIRVMSYPNDGLPDHEWGQRARERLARLAERADRHGVVLAHENCSGWAGANAERMSRLVAEVDSPALRLLFDTGNGIEHGYDAYEMLSSLLPHIVHVHIKDAVGGPGDASYVLPGDGDARVADCLRRLFDAGYSGTLSLEPHLAIRPHEGYSEHESAGRRFVEAGGRVELLVREARRSVGATATTGSPES